MRKKTVKNAAKRAIGINWLISGTCFTTLYFNTRLQDPFNSPKLWIITFLASILAGYVLIRFQQKSIRKNQFTVIFLAMLFTLSIGVSTLSSDNLIASLIGETQRRNGLIGYLSLTIIFVYTVITMQFIYINKIFKAALFTGFILSLYGLLQSTGNDFVEWNNPYNSVIATVGNPNFSSAIMAVLATLCFGIVFFEDFNVYYKISALMTTILLALAIYRSGASQGLVSLLVGIGIIVIFHLYKLNKKLGIVTTALSSVGFMVLVLGMLQYGPMQNFIYKDSISVRGFYWRAGIKMLENNLLNGVGMDRFGTYFKLYREPSYSVRYGFDITTTNAHNVPIQMFATGGLLLGISYILIVFITLFIGIRSIRQLSSANQRIMAVLIASYLSFQAQTLVSIDNIGISIWGWVISGSIIGLATSNFIDPGLKIKTSTSLTILQPAISGTIALISLLLVIVPMAKSESSMYLARNSFNPQAPQNLPYLKTETDKIFANKLSDSNYKFISSVYLYQSGEKIKAKDELFKILEGDPKNLDALNYLALVFEEEGDFGNNLNYRIKIDSLDPWNARNLLEMAKIYRNLNDQVKVSQIRERILSFAPETSEGKSINDLVKIG